MLHKLATTYMLYFIAVLLVIIVTVFFILPAVVIFFVLRVNRGTGFFQQFAEKFSTILQNNNFNRTNDSISKAEALEIFGLREGASEKEIIHAYHRLMKSMHPDKGGSEYFAQKLNQARDVLLNGR